MSIITINNKKYLVDDKNEVSVLINIKYGGYGLSEQAMKMYSDRTGNKIDKYGDYTISRSDPVLIQIFKELGPAINDKCCQINEGKVPVDAVHANAFEIDDYDGAEGININHEKITLYKIIKAFDDGLKLDDLINKAKKDHFE
jgi:hypothetical protein